MTSTLQEQLKALMADGVLAPIDYYFAQFIARFEDEPGVVLAAAMASHALGRQDSCVSLAQRCGGGEAIPGSGIAPPPLEAWRRELLDSGAVGLPGESAPLILDGDALYLSRCHHGECTIAAQLGARSSELAVDESWLAQRLDHYFGAAGKLPDWQKLAAAIALSRRFALITGGPGTGKTTTVIKVLALLLEQQAGAAGSLRIRMAAPTGKAAARLSRSIVAALQNNALIDAELAAIIPSGVSTIHRLLRPLPNSARFRHGADNSLPCDVLLVDEASMIDSELMVQLLAALRGDTRIILLGDRDQLPSVGVGQIVHDLCSELGGGDRSQGLPYSGAQRRFLQRVCGVSLEPWARQGQVATISNCIALLQTSYRFDAHSGIARLAKIVNDGNAAAAAEFVGQLATGQWPDIAGLVPSAANDEWLDRLVQPWLDQHRQFQDAELSVARKLDALAAYQILCAVREGRGSVQQINQYIESQLTSRTAGVRQGYYPGRPIMITENNYSLQLYNGDSGLLLSDGEGQLAAWFEGADGVPRRLPISRLPAHETSYAISVHKSQGSEYRHVALVLPPVEADALTPLVTRELIYTAVTRARHQLTLACTTQALVEGIQRRVQRETGLAARLNESSG